MKPTFKAKLLVDAAMTAAMLLLMAYSLVGEAAHEWIGMGMAALFILHHVLNRRWVTALPKGRYTPFRILQTTLAPLIFLCMVGSMVSGIVLSRYVFRFLPKHGGYLLAEQAHILCAFWGFVLMSVHLGLHWNMVLNLTKKHFQLGGIGAAAFRVAGYLIAIYGAAAFFSRNIGGYLLLKSHFVFYDYTQSVWLFLRDYLAIMGLFVLAGYRLAECLKKT